MRVWTCIGVFLALLLVVYPLIGSSDREMIVVVGAIMLGYFTILMIAVLYVRRWAKQMAAWPCRPLALPRGTPAAPAE